MTFTKPITEIIRQRYSCRNYQEKPIEEETQQRLSEFLKSNTRGPLGTKARFLLAAATEDDRQSLKGLGTYGFIKGATGFIVGTVESGPNDMEDFGYLMEHAILRATDLGLGSCWLGGTFRKSRFGEKISIDSNETMPAVTAIGYVSENDESKNYVRRMVGGAFRLPAEKLFFNIGDPGSYGLPLEMLRLAPSASNKQPWRVVRSGDEWHFYLQRTERYGKNSLLFKILKLADLQRVDMGIAMCHFELSACELGLHGKWIRSEPAVSTLVDDAKYVITWRTKS